MKKFLLAIVFIASLCFSGTSYSAQIEPVLGFGVGLPYGGIGVNLELGMNDYFAPFAAVGSLPDNVGWNLGARLYYPGRGARFRGRLTALYGTNALVEKRDYYYGGDTQYDTEEGFAAGVGMNMRFSRHWAFDIDLLGADVNLPRGYERKGSDVLLALGFSRRW